MCDILGKEEWIRKEMSRNIVSKGGMEVRKRGEKKKAEMPDKGKVRLKAGDKHEGGESWTSEQQTGVSQ